MNKLLSIAIVLLTASTAFGQANIILKRSDPSLSPSTDAAFMYRGNNYELQIKMARQMGLSTSDVFTLYANTNASSMVNFFSNLVGRLSDSNQQTVVWTIGTNDTLMPAGKYVFEALASGSNVTTIMRTSLQMYESLGSTLPEFQGPWGGPAGSIYVSGAGWIPYAGPGTYTNTLTNQVVQTTQSSSNFIVWVSNNIANSVAYWLACVTNGGGNSSSGGGTNIINITNDNNVVVTLTNTQVSVDAVFSNVFNVVFTNGPTIINVTNQNVIVNSNTYNIAISNNNEVNVGNVNVEAWVTNYITLTNVVTLFVTNFVSVGDTFVTVVVTNFTTNLIVVQSVVNVTNINMTAPGPSSINGAVSGGVFIAASGLGLRVTTNGNVITITNDLPTPVAPAGTPLTLQFIPTNQTYVWAPIGVYDGIPASGVGTNIAAFVYVGRQWQNFTVPVGITQIEFYVWGGGGAGSGNSGNSGGFTYMLAPTTPGVQYDIAVAEGGDSAVPTTMLTMTNAWIGGGVRTGNTHAAYGGGGASAVRLTSSTNYLCVASGGGAANMGAGTYGIGGGKDGGSGYTTNSPTNIVVGAGATANDFYGTSAAGGVNPSNAFCNGSFLQAGTCVVEVQSNVTTQVYYPGSGWMGGAGSVIYSTNGANPAVISAAGGNGYVNPAYGWGYSERGGPTYQYTGGMEFPWYLSPAALGGANADGSHGRIVVRY